MSDWRAPSIQYSGTEPSGYDVGRLSRPLSDWKETRRTWSSGSDCRRARIPIPAPLPPSCAALGRPGLLPLRNGVTASFRGSKWTLCAELPPTHSRHAARTLHSPFVTG